MGYAKLTQVGCGLHLRQFARTYIIDDGQNRAAFVTVDALAMAHSVRRQVITKTIFFLSKMFCEGFEKFS